MYSAHFIELVRETDEKITVNVNLICSIRIDAFNVKNNYMIQMASGDEYMLMWPSYEALLREIRHLSYDPGEPVDSDERF